MKKQYYKLLDVIRIVACISVFLYHLGYLKGGFLSVCAFFVLTGYLSYMSFSTNKTSLKEYYKKRLIHIYLPLLAVVFTTICVISFIPTIHWFQLKPETTSVLFGYNNFWQLSVNADYFARHISSPFMHFWYIGILLQFELLFPFIFYGINTLKKKFGKIIPIIILTIIILLSSYYFISRHEIMISYYHTLARCYSLFLGVLLAYIHSVYTKLTFKRFTNYIFYIYLLFFIILQFVVDDHSSLYTIMMLVVSLISCRLIDYATITKSDISSFFDKMIKFFANISYEVYLLQYPVIFFFQYLNIALGWKIFLIIFITFVLSCFLYFCFNIKNKKYSILKFGMIFILLAVCLYGLFQYIIAKDYTSDMNQLKKQLAENEKIIEAKQKDYENRIKQENDSWNNVLSDLENGEKEIANYVTNLPLVAVGDSVMLGATPSLYQMFPNGYFDAAVSRTDYEANRILLSIKKQNFLSENVLIHLGTNGQCGFSCQREIMSTCENRHVFLVTVSNDYDVHVNHSFYELAEMYPNISIIDWAGASNGHSEYFVADGVHLTSVGVAAYRQVIYDGIYHYYYQEFEKKREKIMQEHEKEVNSKIDFYGNHILLNTYPMLQKTYDESRFMIQEEYTVDDLTTKITDEIEAQTISKNIVISIDNPNGISLTDMNKILSLTKNQTIYFIYVYHEPYSFSFENVISLDFYHEIQNNPNYLMVDGIHLSDEGNRMLTSFIQNHIKKDS